MIYDNPVQFVFDNQDLRHLILTKHVYNKYKEERYEMIKSLVSESIVGHWFRHCTCNECALNRIYYNSLQPS
jgi:hypothetical protein